jgi:hypothetical protein
MYILLKVKVYLSYRIIKEYMYSCCICHRLSHIYLTSADFSQIAEKGGGGRKKEKVMFTIITTRGLYTN